MKKTFIVLIFLSILIAGCQRAQNLDIVDAWVRPGSAGDNSAVYFIVINDRVTDDAIVGAESDAAEHVEVHLSAMKEDGTMMMQPQESVLIPGQSRIEFKPGGYHIMLIGLKEGLNIGGEIEVTVKFDKSKDMKLTVPVEEQ